MTVRSYLMRAWKLFVRSYVVTKQQTILSGYLYIYPALRDMNVQVTSSAIATS